MQKTVLEYLDHTAAAFADKMAFQDPKEALTFGELRDRAMSIATALLPYTNGKTGCRVAVAVDRTARSIAGFMGAAYCGGCYVPLDVHMPVERMHAILSAAQPVAVIDGTGSARFRLPEELRLQYNVLDYDALCQTPCDAQALSRVRAGLTDLDPLYIIFTSGSTGMPKGVCVAHRSVVDFADWLAETMQITSDDVLGNQAPFYFDMAGKDIYLALKCGASVHILPHSMFTFTGTLMKKLNAERITALFWAAAAVRMVASSGILEKNPPLYVRRMGFGGEALPARWLNAWRSVLPDAVFMNMYGPTETTIDCTYHIIDRPYADDEPLPIGRACENMQVMLLDDQLRAISQPGVPGELCVKGAGVALGYYGDPERTAASFIQNPLQSAYPEKVYLTGDLCQYGEDGLLYYVARKDSQIKHMGYRIELDEIETAVNAAEGVEIGVCFFDKEQDAIVLCYQGGAQEDALMQQLAQKLPKYMLPNRVVRRERMPYNANGKVDRVLLKRTLLAP